MEHHITIPSEEAELAATLHYPTNNKAGAPGCERWPLILICHGFIGSRVGVDRLFVKAAREFSAQGFLVLRFDYGGCGESTGDYGAGGIDIMIEQTRRVIDYALSMDCVDLSRVILLGHSLGGATALLTAAKDHRVKTLVLWSAVAYPHNDIVRIVGKSEYEKLEPGGAIDHFGYSLTTRFFESMSLNQPYEQLRKFKGDVFIAHGTADEIVPVDYAPLYQKLFWLRQEGQCDLELIFKADHTFSSQSTQEELFTKTHEWLSFIHKRKKDWNDWTI
ncbi:alpha/beta hydrolase family protein [Paenibacillus eucommiae]|uniref:Pimeloyl-ACP methyl ester carboxylesterase n=1 Tax=Paenibacillus eucommiae TaxID=1355755 RepID=A0ABS4J618_9BACL|nr:alpha/beta fold hydrolase [Paenibacillus eucommiae]MBP1995270.1 pimeloyl-ACP methyl ester carboxylesterase [Paenibacillus eucommiae]